MKNTTQTTDIWGKCDTCQTNIRIRNKKYYCPKCDMEFGEAKGVEEALREKLILATEMTRYLIHGIKGIADATRHHGSPPEEDLIKVCGTMLDEVIKMENEARMKGITIQ